MERKVKDFLTDGKLFLKFAALSVIESLRGNPELYNFILNHISNKDTSYRSNYPLLMLSGSFNNHHFIYISDDPHTALILEETEKLYNKLTTELTNDIIDAAIRTSLLTLPTTNNTKTYPQNEIY
jgi:hypothetical protein